MPESVVFNEDCMEVMRRYPDGYFDLAVVDPPYGVGEDGGKNRSKYVKQKNGNRLFVQDGKYEKKRWDTLTPPEEYFRELKRVSKNQIIWGINYYPFAFPGGRIIWDKCNDGSSQSDAEIAYCSLNSRVEIFRFMWRGMLQGKSITEGKIQQGNKRKNEKRIHPTQKPVALYLFVLKKYSKPGDRILDTHLGSGSSRIAAYELKMNFVGCEIDTDYFEMQEQRFVDYSAQENMFLLEQESIFE